MIRIENNFYYKNSRASREKKSAEKVKTLNLLKRFNMVSPIIQKEDYRFQKALEDRPSLIKRSYKKKGFDKVLQETLRIISKTEGNYVTKEDIARDLKVKEHEVENVFHRLNLEGILSQRKSNYAHDTNRNPMFPGGESGWASDIYYIRNAEKAKKLLNIKA